MSQASRETAYRRIEAGLDRLAQAIQRLPEPAAANTLDMVSRERHEALTAAHNLLRNRAEAAVAGIDRLLTSGGNR